MTTYRTDDGARWGAGKGANLTPSEVDLNFWGIIERLVAVETNPVGPNEISGFTVVGSQMTITMQDGTVYGPYTLPKAIIRFRGDWVATTAYQELDLVTVPDDGLYLVLRDHTAAATFDPVATDGGGNQLYRYLMPMATNVIAEAPEDGTLYGRMDAAWVQVTIDWADLTGKPATFAPSAHTHPSADISDFAEAVQDVAGALVVAGANITVTYDDGAGTLTIGGAAAAARPSVVTKSASYTFAVADAANPLGAFIDYNAAGPGTFTIPDDATADLPIGTVIGGGQIGAGPLTIAAAAGVTLNGVSAGSTTLNGSQSEYSIRKIAANDWRIAGDHPAVA